MVRVDPLALLSEVRALLYLLGALASTRGIRASSVNFLLSAYVDLRADSLVKNWSG